MNENIAATSRSSYYTHVIDGHAETQRERILECLMDSRVPMTRLQISKYTGIRLTSICGRVKALMDNGQIHVDFEGIDPNTGKMA